VTDDRVGLSVTWLPGADAVLARWRLEEVAMGYDVVIGLDVGKTMHHAVALDGDGLRLVDREVANTEAALRELFGRAAREGELLVVVDQLHSIGALPVTVAQVMGIEVAYLPGLSMRRLADLQPGSAKTDARDAYVIADAARTAPHALRTLGVPDETRAALSMLLGYDDDLATQSTAAINRLRGLLSQIHPSLEKSLGTSVYHRAVLGLLLKAGGPTGLRRMGRARIDRELAKGAPRIHARLTEQIWAGLDAQTVVVPGTAAAERVLPGLAAQLLHLFDERERIARDVEEVLDAHPLAEVLTSMPGVGVKIAARLLAEIGTDVSGFATAAHLASYAGLAPVTRRSGTSIRGEHVSRSGNRRLKNALFIAAFASLHADPPSRAYYDRKRAEGKTHNAALICLARRKTDVLFAMIRDHTSYVPAMPTAA
jgi:transposase